MRALLLLCELGLYQVMFAPPASGYVDAYSGTAAHAWGGAEGSDEEGLGERMCAQAQQCLKRTGALLEAEEAAGRGEEWACEARRHMLWYSALLLPLRSLGVLNRKKNVESAVLF